MSRILLALLMLQAGGAPTGSVTGIVRTANGIPASGVRVYAQQVRKTAEANSAVAPLEGLAQTDGSGQYRLELPAGRYYIASGSVSSPTYFPGTTNVASARPVLVTSGGIVERIDFGSFVAATNNVPPTIVAPSLGSLSGTVRYPDGSLAPNLSVSAFPSTLALPPAIVISGSFAPRSARTDSMGRYRIASVPANIYYLAAGFAETPGFYTASTTQPKPVLMSSGASIASLDFTVPFPPAPTGTTISGQVFAKDGSPAAGATIRIVMPRPAGPVTNSVLPSINEKADVRVSRDGTFTFSDVVPGFYNIQVFLSKANQFDSVVVGESPVTNLRLSLPAVVFSGQILLEDGRAVPDPELFVAGVLSTVNNPNLILSSILPMSAGGAFEGLPENNEYRFYFRNWPEEYEVRSLTAGAVDLLKETLKVDGTKSIFVETRVALRGTARPPGSVRVVGIAIDGSGSPSAATRVHLCCLNSNSLEVISTALRPDGSFEFSGVPPGSYTAELQWAAGQASPKVTRANVDVESDQVKVRLISTPVQQSPLAPVSSQAPVTIDVPKLR